MKSQNASPDANSLYDCVATCLASAFQFLTYQDFEPNAVKDAVYGAAYVGDTAAANYVAYAESHGIALWSYNDTPAALVAHAHMHVEEGRPVVFTEPDPYSSNPAYSHVCVFYGYDTGTLTAMDPWQGTAITRSDTEWAALLLDGQIWICERNGATVVPNGWSDDGTILKGPNGVPVVLGCRAYVLAHQWSPDNWPLVAEAGRNPLEMSNPSLGSGTWQPFRWTVLEWIKDSNQVVEMWTGQEIVALRSQQPTISAAQVSEVQAAATLIGETAQHILATFVAQGAHTV